MHTHTQTQTLTLTHTEVGEGMGLGGWQKRWWADYLDGLLGSKLAQIGLQQAGERVSKPMNT